MNINFYNFVLIVPKQGWLLWIFLLFLCLDIEKLMICGD